MKKLLLTITLFYSSYCFSSGNFGYVQSHYLNSEDSTYQLYLSIYEDLSKHLVYKSWSGLQMSDKQTDFGSQWIHTEHFLMFKLTDRLLLGPGAGYNLLIQDNSRQDISIKLKVDYRAW